MKKSINSDKKNTFVAPKKGFIILIIFILISVLMFAFSALFSSEGFSDAFGTSSEQNNVSQSSKDPKSQFTIVIDAGHGGEDPGAVANNAKEKDINLNIAKSLEKLFADGGYKVKLTRSEDVLLYNKGEENQKKQYDLKNRVVLTNSFENPVFISIHANKFYMTSCKGAQVFFGKNQKSSSLALNIQDEIKNTQTDNNRVIKDGTETSFILSRLECPAVLVECGFLSNAEDAANLLSQEYIDALAKNIYDAFLKWENNTENTETNQSIENK